MDLTIPLENTILNIRVAVLVKTPTGYIFEFSKKNNFYFVIGGRVKTNESSDDAAKREIFEEIGVQLENLKIRAIIENFFTEDNKKFHEICFVYNAEIDKEPVLSSTLVKFTLSEIENIDLKPVILKKLIANQTCELEHIVFKDN